MCLCFVQPSLVDTAHYPLARHHKVLAVEGTGCARLILHRLVHASLFVGPCKPTPLPYSTDRWNTYRYMSLCFVTVSFLCSSFVAKTHFSARNGLRNMIPAFSASYALTSLVMFFNILIDWNRDLHCYNQVTFHHAVPYCIATGALFNYAFLCGATWTLIISLHLYLTVVKRVKKVDMNGYMKFMWGFALGFPLLLCIVGLSNNAFGMEMEFPLLFCWFSEKNDRAWYLALFAVPTLVISCAALVFMTLTLVQVSRTLMKNAEEEVKKSNQEHEDADDRDNTQSRQTRDSSSSTSARKRKKEAKEAKRRWKKRLWYNQRTLIFILVFSFASIVTSDIAIDLYSHEFDVEAEELDHYFHCLLNVSQTSDMDRQDMKTHPQHVCGHPDESVSIWSELFFFVFWIQLLGVLPLLVYGVKGKLKKAWLVVKQIRLTGSRLSGSSTRRFRARDVSSVLPSVLEDQVNEYGRRDVSEIGYSRSRFRHDSETGNQARLSDYRVPSDEDKDDEDAHSRQNRSKKVQQGSSLKIKFVDSSANSTDGNTSGTGQNSTSGQDSSGMDHSSGDDLLSLIPIIGPFVNAFRRLRTRAEGGRGGVVSGHSSGFDPEERQFRRLEGLEMRSKRREAASSSHSEEGADSEEETRRRRRRRRRIRNDVVQSDDVVVEDDESKHEDDESKHEDDNNELYIAEEDAGHMI